MASTDGLREDALAAVLSLVQHHLTEGQIVVDGRDQAPGAGRERGRAAPLTSLGLVIEFERAGFEIGSSSWSRTDRAGQRAR